MNSRSGMKWGLLTVVGMTMVVVGCAGHMDLNPEDRVLLQDALDASRQVASDANRADSAANRAEAAANRADSAANRAESAANRAEAAASKAEQAAQKAAKALELQQKK